MCRFCSFHLCVIGAPARKMAVPLTEWRVCVLAAQSASANEDGSKGDEFGRVKLWLSWYNIGKDVVGNVKSGESHQKCKPSEIVERRYPKILFIAT